MKIKLEDIGPDPNNPNVFSDEEYESLKNSIILRGIQKPIELRTDSSTTDKYIVVDGEHRLRVLRDLGCTEIPNEKISENQIVILSAMSEEVSLEKLYDNTLRGHTHPYEFIKLLKEFMNKKRITQTELAKQLGISESKISKMLSITRSKSEELLQALENDSERLELSFKHYEILASLNDTPDLQYEIYSKHVAEQRKSANDLKKVVDGILKNQSKMKATLEYLSINDRRLHDELKPIYWKHRHDNDSCKLLEQEIGIRTGRATPSYFYYACEDYSKKDIKKLAKSHYGEVTGKEVKKVWKLYMFPKNIEEIREKLGGDIK